MEMLSKLKGVTPRRLEILKKMGISTIFDLIGYLPKSYSDYSHLSALEDAFTSSDNRIIVKVIATSMQRISTRTRLPLYKIRVEDATSHAYLLSFGYKNHQIKVGSSEQYLISGVFKYRSSHLECSQFTVEGIIRDSSELSNKIQQHNQIVPIYSLSSGITQKTLRYLIQQGLEMIRFRFRENIPSYLLEKYHYLSRWEALWQIHFPENFTRLEQAQHRLKYSEFFHLQFQFALKKNYFKTIKKQQYHPPFTESEKLIASLPFHLTQDQEKTLHEIESDLISPRAMHRLLMGDVGSGKTLVAFLALLKVVESGYQGVFLAPTEILAKQHFQTLSQYISPFQYKIELLTGSTKPKERRDILISLYQGDTQILIGTHAVFSQDIRFARLGMVVIDEQHKFGVNQRMKLVEKGDSPDVLVMSATPIPRTLGLVHFGDMDISAITTKPQGRLPVTTKWLEESEISIAYDTMRKEIAKGHQGYIVYPLVEESEKSRRKSVLEGFQLLKKSIFPELKIDLLHGQMTDQEKNLAIRKFRSGETHILVSTIVVEVGVDVPNATCLIIEDATTFGLSTLHQLRGRVGRSSAPSFCFLSTVPKTALTLEASQRMESMVEYHDGFLLSQKDLELRGSGNLLSTNQSGGSGLRVSNLLTDQTILEKARQDAFHILKEDPQCEDPRHENLKKWVRKFEEEVHGILHN